MASRAALPEKMRHVELLRPRGRGALRLWTATSTFAGTHSAVAHHFPSPRAACAPCGVASPRAATAYHPAILLHLCRRRPTARRPAITASRLPAPSAPCIRTNSHHTPHHHRTHTHARTHVRTHERRTLHEVDQPHPPVVACPQRNVGPRAVVSAAAVWGRAVVTDVTGAAPTTGESAPSTMTRVAPGHHTTTATTHTTHAHPSPLLPPLPQVRAQCYALLLGVAPELPAHDEDAGQRVRPER